MGNPTTLECYNFGDCKFAYSNCTCIAPSIRFVNLYISSATAQSGSNTIIAQNKNYKARLNTCKLSYHKLHMHESE